MNVRRAPLGLCCGLCTRIMLSLAIYRCACALKAGLGVCGVCMGSDAVTCVTCVGPRSRGQADDRSTVLAPKTNKAGTRSVRSEQLRGGISDQELVWRIVVGSRRSSSCPLCALSRDAVRVALVGVARDKKRLASQPLARPRYSPTAGQAAVDRMASAAAQFAVVVLTPFGGHRVKRLVPSESVGP
jgi:hypothetical protein